MGQDIDSSRFDANDFLVFEEKLREETRILGEWFADGHFDDDGKVSGYELEVCLIDDNGDPAPLNKEFLDLSGKESDLPVVPELAKFNFELNSDPCKLSGDVFKRMHEQLDENWQRCCKHAESLGCSLLMIGMLPTLKEDVLSLDSMSGIERFRALNEQILRLRQGRPLYLDIAGREHLQTSHGDVMLESAATSFQLHLQMEPELAPHYYNAAHILSAPMVAIAANSPYLFGHDLWDETRIPLFEQAVAAGHGEGNQSGRLDRVTFGASYIERSLFESFLRNQEDYPILLPALSDALPEQFDHLRIHNGTIWRWNRPLIGFNEQGLHSLRIEHRAIPAGPTVVDSVANAALFFGAVEILSQRMREPEKQLSFEVARNNFYAAAKYGLNATLSWQGGRKVNVMDLIREEILPMAREGLASLDIDKDDIEDYMQIIAGRLQQQQNGTIWQRGYIAKHGKDFGAMVKAYHERQQGGCPVHEWSI
ncbi:glutamate--cysteine ligase [Pseudomonadota bacterium]